MKGERRTITAKMFPTIPQEPTRGRMKLLPSRNESKWYFSAIFIEKYLSL